MREIAIGQNGPSDKIEAARGARAHHSAAAEPPGVSAPGASSAAAHIFAAERDGGTGGRSRPNSSMESDTTAPGSGCASMTRSSCAGVATSSGVSALNSSWPTSDDTPPAVVASSRSAGGNQVPGRRGGQRARESGE